MMGYSEEQLYKLKTYNLYPLQPLFWNEPYYNRNYVKK